MLPRLIPEKKKSMLNFNHFKRGSVTTLVRVNHLLSGFIYHKNGLLVHIQCTVIS